MPTSSRHDPYAAWRYRDYRLFAGAWMCMVFGQQIETMAVGWEIVRRIPDAKEAALAVGFVGLIQALPIMLLALPAGHLADRFNRRTLIAVTVALNVLWMAGLAWVAWRNLPIEGLYLFLILSAICQGIGWPARSALVPQTIPPQHLANGVAWNSSLFATSAAVGSALGGLIITFLGTPAGFLFSAALCAVAAGLIALIHVRPTVRRNEPLTIRSLFSGLEFVFRAPLILSAISLDMFAVLLGGAVYLLPIFAEHILHVGPWGFGILRAAPAVGAGLMAIIQAHLPPYQRAGRALLWAVAGFGVVTLVFGVSQWFLLSVIMLFLSGALDSVSVVIRHTLVQLRTPDHMRGRVSAVNNVFISASNDLGGLESGLTAWLLGPVGAVVLGGFGTLVVVAVIAARFPALRRLGPLAEVQPVDEDQIIAPVTR
ncbi:MAG: MFS transporter [Phycisphaeraceae bacterium]